MITIEFDQGKVVEFTIKTRNWDFIGAPLTGDWNMNLYDDTLDPEDVLMHILYRRLAKHPDEMRSVVAAALKEIRTD